MTTLDTPDQALAGLVAAPAVPSIRELAAAMTGIVPTEHPAASILRAAFLLASVDIWIDPDLVATSTADSGTTVLWELGIFDIGQLVRARLIDDINHAASASSIGPAVDGVARAWSQYQRATRCRAASRFDDARHRRAVAALIAARAHYTRVRRRTRNPGFGQAPGITNSRAAVTG